MNTLNRRTETLIDNFLKLVPGTIRLPIHVPWCYLHTVPLCAPVFMQKSERLCV